MIIWKYIRNYEDYTYEIYKLYKTNKTSVLQLLSHVAVFKSKLVSKELSEVGVPLILGSVLEEAGDLHENRKHMSGLNRQCNNSLSSVEAQDLVGQ